MWNLPFPHLTMWSAFWKSCSSLLKKNSFTDQLKSFVKQSLRSLSAVDIKAVVLWCRWACTWRWAEWRLLFSFCSRWSAGSLFPTRWSFSLCLLFSLTKTLRLALDLYLPEIEEQQSSAHAQMPYDEGEEEEPQVVEFKSWFDRNNTYQPF